MKTLRRVAFALAMFVTISCTNDTMEKKVDDLYSKMTIQERVAQLHGIYLGQFFNANGELNEALCKELIPNGVGHFSQFCVSDQKTPEQMRDMVAKMQNWLMGNTPSGVPALFHEEVLSGVAAFGATVYPQQIGLACSFNTELASLKTYQTADALRKMGGALALSPMVDVVKNPSFNRLEESYGEDSYLSAAMGTAFVKGLQHGNLKEGVAACSKHFLGYGGGGEAPEKELMEEILLPHETIIREAGSRVLMTGYHAVHGTKAVASSELQRDILRDYLGFTGVTVSDYGSIEQIPGEPDPAVRAAIALTAGNDVEFPTSVNYSHIQEAMERGLLSEETFAAAVKRVLRLKAELGLLDKTPNLYAQGDIDLDPSDARKTSYELATQSVVLLQNDGVLPLKGDKKILVTGPNANSMWAMLGDYTYHSMRFFWQRQIQDDMNPVIVNLRSALESKLPEGSTLLYSRGCDWTEEVETVIEDSGDERAVYMRSIQGRKVDSGEVADEKEAMSYAAQSDVIIAAMGENVILCGENRDRTSLKLPGKQEEYVEKLLATGKPVILVLFGGRAQIISSVADRCAAIIQAWYPGEEGGNALADIVYGNVSPSGKLSVSYPSEAIYEPICYSYSSTKDERIKWPFGFGLSYSTFAYSDLKVKDSHKCSSGDIELSFKIKNTGVCVADEIAQLYLSGKDGQNIRPRSLQAFARVHLEPGQTKQVVIRMNSQQFGYYKEGKWVVDPGCYSVKIGSSSETIELEKTIELVGPSYVKPIRDAYFAKVVVK